MCINLLEIDDVINRNGNIIIKNK